MTLQPLHLNFLIYEENFILFFISVANFQLYYIRVQEASRVIPVVLVSRHLGFPFAPAFRPFLLSLPPSNFSFLDILVIPWTECIHSSQQFAEHCLFIRTSPANYALPRGNVVFLKISTKLKKRKSITTVQ